MIEKGRKYTEEPLQAAVFISVHLMKSHTNEDGSDKQWSVIGNEHKEFSSILETIEPEDGHKIVKKRFNETLSHWPHINSFDDVESLTEFMRGGSEEKNKNTEEKKTDSTVKNG